MDWSIEDEKLANLAANNNTGEWDDIPLSKLLKELNRTSTDINLSGFEDAEIKKLLNDIEKEINNKSETMPEIIEVVIECKNEKEHEEIYKKLIQEGYKCRLLTL